MRCWREPLSKKLPDGEPTIASHLQDAGWSTVGIISNPRIGEHVDLDRGFSTFRNLRTTSEDNIGSRSKISNILPDLEIGDHLYDLRERLRNLDSIPRRYLFPFLAFRTYQYASD